MHRYQAGAAYSSTLQTYDIYIVIRTSLIKTVDTVGDMGELM
jgi:hypothetical protein